ncbi:MAG: hypothetical protein ABIB43_06820 [archaeon]
MVFDIQETIDISKTSKAFLKEVKKSNKHFYLPTLLEYRTKQLDTNSKIYKSFLEFQLNSDKVPEECDTPCRGVGNILSDPFYMVQHTYGELIAIGCIIGDFFLSGNGTMPSADIISPEGLIKAGEKYESASYMHTEKNDELLTWLNNFSQCDKTLSSGILKELNEAGFSHNMELNRTPMLETGYRGIFLAAYESKDHLALRNQEK